MQLGFKLTYKHASKFSNVTMLCVLYCFLGIALLGDLQTAYRPRLDDSQTLTQVFIIANDGTRGQMEFSEEFCFLTVNETSRVLQVPVTRAFGTYGDVSVFIYSQTSNNAVLGQDYEFVAQELLFASGENSKLVNITIQDDESPEADEAFELVLASPKGGVTLGTHHIASITIAENDGAGGVIQFATNDSLTLQESFSSEGSPTSVDIQLARGPGLFGDVEVSYTVLDSLGNETTDISPSHGTVRLLNQQNTAIISLSVVDDSIPEFTEYLTVKLSSRFSSLIGNIAEKRITIVRSDAPNGLLSISDANNETEISVEENRRPVLCQVRRSGGLLGNVSITVQTVPQSASVSSGSSIYVTTVQSFEFGTSGYCSHGKYLLALNVNGTSMSGSGQSQLLKWDGLYKHLAYIETNNAIKCIASTIFGHLRLIIINGGANEAVQVDSHLYKITQTDSIETLHTFTTTPTVDAIWYEMANTFNLALITAEDRSNGRHTLHNFVIREDRVSKTWELPVSTATSISILKDIAVITQRESVKFYNASRPTWILQQTIPAEGVKSVTIGKYTERPVLFVSLDQSLAVYRLDGSTFVSVIELAQADIQSVTSFYLMGQQLYLLLTSSRSFIASWDGSNLIELWEDNSTNAVAPLAAPRQLSDEIWLASYGEPGFISAVAMLERADYLPRYAEEITHRARCFITFAAETSGGVLGNLLIHVLQLLL